MPRGALRANGDPHPHAGTGFAVGQAHWFRFDEGRFTWRDPERKDMNEVYQLVYDAGTFTARRSELRAQNRTTHSVSRYGVGHPGNRYQQRYPRWR